MENITRVIRSYFVGKDWEIILNNFIDDIFSLIIILISLSILRWVTIKVFKRTYLNRRGQEPTKGRELTVYRLIKNVINYTYYLLVVYVILTALGVPVATLVAGAGILSLAIGLGAQGFVSDIINGLFIFFERQIDVGDSVTLDTISGEVEQIGLRTTKIRGWDGVMHYIPNRQIIIVSNHSRRNARILIDIRIYPNTPIHLLEEVIQKVSDEKAPQHEEISTPPQLRGIHYDQWGHLVYRVQLFSHNSSAVPLKQEFFTAYLRAIYEAGIELPTESE